MTMVLLPLLLATALADVPAPPDRAEAERLARAGNYAQALERFREFATADPDDLDTRVWIGRLHVWMGHAGAGESVFRSVLDVAPDRVDALLGLGAALTALGRTDQAIETLDRAEKLAPNDEEVLAAQGAAHRAAGHATLAEAYLLRAAVIRPEDREIADQLENITRERSHLFSATYTPESYNATATSGRFGSASLNLRANDRLRVLGRVDVQRKFGVNEARGGGGLMFQAMPNVTVRGMALFGGTTVVLPRGDVAAGVDITRNRTTWGGAFRFVRFDGADFAAFTPAVSLKLNERTVLGLSYTRSQTSYDVGSSIAINSGDARLQVRLKPRVWIGGGYARNLERLDMLSPDRLGSFQANTVTGTARLELKSLTTLTLDYDYQRRAGDVRLIRLLGSLIYRF
jgi:tetratricopeptide (TPR) repeat protein